MKISFPWSKKQTYATDANFAEKLTNTVLENPYHCGLRPIYLYDDPLPTSSANSIPMLYRTRWLTAPSYTLNSQNM